MAIGIFRSLEFGGVNSADYGVYITGEGVYDAPERSVESVSVPGRNGAILIDNGRFENIEVKYKAGVTGANQSEFAQNIADFRNAVLSQKGYQRLTDEYNPNEYRMATYISGLEVETTEGHQGTAGEFELTFNCKPQRFLTSGETPLSVSSGDTITNPTLFDSQPMIEVEGEGDFSVNGFEMNIDDGPLGTITLDVNSDKTINVSDSQLNIGDEITFTKIQKSFQFMIRQPVNDLTGTTSSDGFGNTQVTVQFDTIFRQILAYIDIDNYTTTYETKTVSTNFTVTAGAGAVTITGQFIMNIDADNGLISFSRQLTTVTNAQLVQENLKVNEVTAYSTKSRNGHVYIDCELGEAYKIEDGEVISLNNFFTLGANLPVLSPGSNSVTYDNTITLFKITPRWWLI